MIRSKGVRVPPRSTENIRQSANKIREVLNVVSNSSVEKLDIVEVIDILLPQCIPQLEVNIIQNDKMGEDHGRTYPDKFRVELRESTYVGAFNGSGRDIFTIAHEIGHLFLHQNAASFARAKQPSVVKPYENSEWQADQFAAELLMPYDLCLNCINALEIQYRFGVSKSAAENRFKSINRRPKR
jgi:Zn-dependent peptidase ImmA (M78 family)